MSEAPTTLGEILGEVRRIHNRMDTEGIREDLIRQVLSGIDRIEAQHQTNTKRFETLEREILNVKERMAALEKLGG